MPRGEKVFFRTADGKAVSFRTNPRRRRRGGSRAEFRAQHLARKPRGWRVRTVSPGDGRHRIRIAFPPGPRRTGAGRVLEILHPRGENPTCELASNPIALEKQYPKELEGAKVLITLPTQKKEAKAAARNPGPGELVILGLGNPKRRRRARRNPDEIDQAADLYREFHGKEPGEVLKLQHDVEVRKDYTALGPLLELRGSVNGSRWTIQFDRDKPMVASSPDGQQLYILGGDQNIDSCLGELHTDANRDLVDLGQLKNIVYFDRKAQDNFHPVEYTHDFEDPLPRAHYDRLNRRLVIVGGKYHVAKPGIEH